jgi:CheY-like chemotaxis protein
LLVVDNDERIVYYLETLFTKRGYAVYAAQGVGGAALRHHAVELAQAVRPHVAIVDLRLDDEYTDDPTGLALLPELASARCILYSAYLRPTVLSQVKRQYNVFDWVDKQDVERLYTVVDEAAYQTSAERRGLTILWPGSWQREKIVHALFREAATQPEITILDDIIAQLFCDNRRIVPETVNGAVDGLRSVVRGRSVIAKIYADHLQPMVLKLGLARRTHREFENYQAHIHGFLPGLFHTQIEKHTLFWDLGGTVYSFVGAGQQALPTFAIHYAQTAEADKILAPLRHLFRAVWQPHYEAAVPMSSSTLYAAYADLFHLEEKLAQIDRVLLPTLAGLVDNPLDPVQWVQTFGRDSSIPTARQAVTHGDLHGDNLFVEEERAWLIDFERTGPSHALRDFAELEVDIFARLIPQERVDWATLQRLAEWLVSPTMPGAFPDSAQLDPNPAVQKAQQVISGVRALAQEVVRHSDQREQLWAMLFDALFVASISAMPENQRLRALLYAGVICRRLSTWHEAWPHPLAKP